MMTKVYSLATERRRTGKTAKDKATGAWAKRFENRSIRQAWINSERGNNTGKPREPFPAHTCNGKKNRYNHLPKCNTKPGDGKAFADWISHGY